jgi:hypothetical protein
MANRITDRETLDRMYGGNVAFSQPTKVAIEVAGRRSRTEPLDLDRYHCRVSGCGAHERARLHPGRAARRTYKSQLMRPALGPAFARC